MDLQLLLRVAHRTGQQGPLDMVRLTLDRMAAGGIYDHLGGGFARYSVDARWLVPHFEKMLYDNALLAGAYLDAYLVTGDDELRPRRARDARLRPPRHDRPGRRLLQHRRRRQRRPRRPVLHLDAGRDRSRARRGARGDVRPRVRCDATSAISKAATSSTCRRRSSSARRSCSREPHELAAELAESREKLFAAREKRVRPGRDDKVIVAWNGLMIDAMARAGAALNEPEYVITADEAANFILRRMRRDDGRLLHTWRHGARQARRLPRRLRVARQLARQRCTKPTSTSGGSTKPCG